MVDSLLLNGQGLAARAMPWRRARNNGPFSDIQGDLFVPSLFRITAAAFVSLCVVPAALAQSAAVTLPSGLIYQSLKEGSGASPAATDVVKVHYRGTFPDNGKEFDSSYKRNEPTEFPLNGVIPCWTEGVQKMKPGGKAKLTCPPAIAYGTRGAGGVIPPNATLNFEIELISVTKR
jgi:FKBP-type peptidyl-prolyl cis-trans isomerase FkpA